MSKKKEKKGAGGWGEKRGRRGLSEMIASKSK